MTVPRLASVVIDNYNYGGFLREAIESALCQTYPNTEVIVVDDGSTDDSRKVIAEFADRVTVLEKENGGQGSAFNAGFALSRGEVVVFLDADDVLLPTALERAMPFFDDPGVVKVHWPLWLIDSSGHNTGRVFPAAELPYGNLRATVTRLGPTQHLSAPNSGNAWSRALLERLLPLPEELYRNGCDTYFLEAAPFFGSIGFVPEPQTLYRQHATNDHLSMSADAKIDRELRFYDHYAAVLIQYCRDEGIPVDPEVWKLHSWWHRHRRAVDQILTLPDANRPIVVADAGTWEPGPIGGRRRIAFPEHEGAYSGIPSSDEAAIGELRRIEGSEARFLVVGWPAFWWLEYFPDFGRDLHARHRCLRRTDDVLVFDLAGADRS